MGIKGIFFDLIGTLLQFSDETMANKVWENSLFQSIYSIDSQITREAFEAEIVNFFKPDIPKSEEPNFTLYERRIQELMQNLKMSFSLADIKKFSSKTVNDWGQYLILPSNASQILKYCVSNYSTVLITNFDHPPFVHRILKEKQISNNFHHTIISAEVGIEKPSPKIFNLALEKTGLKPSEVIFIGDSVEHDIIGAFNVGIIPVHLKKELPSPEELEIMKNAQFSNYIRISNIAEIPYISSLNSKD